MTDNWIHRSKGMLCKTCMYYVPKKTTDLTTDPLLLKAPNLGRCRRRAPTMAGWPVMFPTDWCGEHKLDENKMGEHDA